MTEKNFPTWWDGIVFWFFFAVGTAINGWIALVLIPHWIQ
jgi:hypothetical protein